jgi:GT2 family glycosyltransferase
MKVSIIIPAHNRRSITLACLQRLKQQGVLSWANVILVDDGSTDGTSEAVHAGFPDTTLLSGDGHLWWGGAIQLGIWRAYFDGADYVIWLNDDCHTRSHSLSSLLQVSQAKHAITVAPCILRETGTLHYGGLRQTKDGVEVIPCQQNEVIPCDTICGNCVCVPREVIERIGALDISAFPHFAGDADYGFRARDAGFPLFIVGDAVCDSSYGSAKNRQSWLLGDMSLGQLWALCFHPMNGTLARPGFIFKIRHWGFYGYIQYAKAFIKLILVSVLRLIFPRSLRLFLFSRNHTTYQHIQAVKQWETTESA